jgi:hypothetical protein
MSNFCFVCYFSLHFNFAIHSSCVICSAVFLHYSNISSQICPLKMAPPIILYFFSFFCTPLTHCAFSFNYWSFHVLYFIWPSFLYIPAYSISTYYGLLYFDQSTPAKLLDQHRPIRECSEKQTVYRHVINKPITVRATKYRTFALKRKSE